MINEYDIDNIIYNIDNFVYKYSYNEYEVGKINLSDININNIIINLS